MKTCNLLIFVFFVVSSLGVAKLHAQCSSCSSYALCESGLYNCHSGLSYCQNSIVSCEVDYNSCASQLPYWQSQYNAVYADYQNCRSRLAAVEATYNQAVQAYNGEVIHKRALCQLDGAARNSWSDIATTALANSMANQGLARNETLAQQAIEHAALIIPTSCQPVTSACQTRSTLNCPACSGVTSQSHRTLLSVEATHHNDPDPCYYDDCDPYTPPWTPVPTDPCDYCYSYSSCQTALNSCNSQLSWCAASRNSQCGARDSCRARLSRLQADYQTTNTAITTCNNQIATTTANTNDVNSKRTTQQGLTSAVCSNGASCENNLRSSWQNATVVGPEITTNLTLQMAIQQSFIALMATAIAPSQTANLTALCAQGPSNYLCPSCPPPPFSAAASIAPSTVVMVISVLVTTLAGAFHSFL